MPLLPSIVAELFFGLEPIEARFAVVFLYSISNSFFDNFSRRAMGAIGYFRHGNSQLTSYSNTLPHSNQSNQPF
jgi:hypothetical protein